MRDRADLQGCAVRCCHCGIRFLTHPRNAGRQQLGCPFGCRQHQRRRRAAERSRKYYQTESGRRKKKRLNGNRSKFAHDLGVATACDSRAATPAAQAPLKQSDSENTAVARGTHGNVVNRDVLNGGGLNGSGGEAARDGGASAAVGETPLEQATAEIFAVRLAGFVFDERALRNASLLAYVRMLASLLERRTISGGELLAMLRTRMRQHSMGRLPRREYVLRYLNEHPP